MSTHGRILHSLVAVSLFATVTAWTGSAGNERASAADLAPPIVTKAVPLGAVPQQHALHSTSVVSRSDPAKPRNGDGTAARQQKPAPEPETAHELSNQTAANAGHNSPAEGPGPLRLQAAPHDLKTTAQGAGPQQVVVAPPSQPPASTVVGSNPPPQGEPPSATAAKSALPLSEPSSAMSSGPSSPSSAPRSAKSVTPPPGPPAPASEAKNNSAQQSGPAANSAPASPPPDSQRLLPAKLAAADGTTGAPGAKPAKPEPGRLHPK